MAHSRQPGALWAPEEDLLLLRHVARHGTKHWGQLQSSGVLPHRDQKACCNRFILLKRRFVLARSRGERLTHPSPQRTSSSPPSLFRSPGSPPGQPPPHRRCASPPSARRSLSGEPGTIHGEAPAAASEDRADAWDSGAGVVGRSLCSELEEGKPRVPCFLPGPGQSYGAAAALPPDAHGTRSAVTQLEPHAGGREQVLLEEPLAAGVPQACTETLPTVCDSLPGLINRSQRGSPLVNEAEESFSLAAEANLSSASTAPTRAWDFPPPEKQGYFAADGRSLAAGGDPVIDSRSTLAVLGLNKQQLRSAEDGTWRKTAWRVPDAGLDQEHQLPVERNPYWHSNTDFCLEAGDQQCTGHVMMPPDAFMESIASAPARFLFGAELESSHERGSLSPESGFGEVFPILPTSG